MNKLMIFIIVSMLMLSNEICLSCNCEEDPPENPEGCWICMHGEWELDIYNGCCPTGETTYLAGWYDPFTLFSAQILPTYLSYEGLYAMETQGPLGSDGCWFNGSNIPKWETIQGGDWW